jgi:hypothetical protein
VFQTKVTETVKTRILCAIIFLRKSCHLWDNVEKYGRAGQTTDDNIIRRMRFACWITEARHVVRICNTYCFCTIKRLRESASMLRIAYVASVVLTWGYERFFTGSPLPFWIPPGFPPHILSWNTQSFHQGQGQSTLWDPRPKYYCRAVCSIPSVGRASAPVRRLCV